MRVCPVWLQPPRELKLGDPDADFCVGVGGAKNVHNAHRGPSSVDGLADSRRVINYCIEALGVWTEIRRWDSRVRGWIDGDTSEEELVQHVYSILKDHGLATGLGTCSASASPFILNTNIAGASAGPGTWALHVQLHDRLTRERGDRDTEHDLRATKRTKYDLGTTMQAFGIDKASRGVDLHSLGKSKFALNSSTAPRLLVTHERTLVCPK